MKLNIFFVCSLAICFSSTNLLLLTARGCWAVLSRSPFKKEAPVPSAAAWAAVEGVPWPALLWGSWAEESLLASGLAPFPGISLSVLRPYGSLRVQRLATSVSAPVPAWVPELFVMISSLCPPSFVQPLLFLSPWGFAPTVLLPPLLHLSLCFLESLMCKTNLTHFDTAFLVLF